ncbi:S9 family peptidase [Acetobacter cerevisiae]|uniref:Acyl-peptide hydrolase n=1 Tax=Acetobacter cerevisiae TaxID=178900 RepID=A0A149V9E3_9PROT|nr:alpha/beta fold hydrolase [Acetobacter cerevisiae]KXV76777.1 peptidase S9 [Acetobacter cerevisiae]
MMIRSAFAAALLAGGLYSASLASATPLDEAGARHQIAALLSMPFATNLVGASNANRFAWVEKRNGVRNILAADAAGTPKALTHFTQDDGTNLWGVALSPNGKTLAYVEGGDPEFPDASSPNPNLSETGTRQSVNVVLESGRQMRMGEGWNPTFSPDGATLAFSRKGSLFLAPVGKVAKEVMSVPGSLTSLQWAPDGSALLFTLDRGSHALIGLWHVKTATMTFLAPALGQDSLPIFSPDGHSVAFVREHRPLTDKKTEKGSFWSLHVYDLASNTDHVVWTPPAGTGARFAVPEGSSLLWSDNAHLLFPWEGSGWMRVCTVAASGTGIPTCLTPDKAEVSAYRLSQDRKTLFYTSNVGNVDAWHAWQQALDGSSPQRLTRNEDMETDLAVAGGKVGVIAANVTQTAHPVVVGPEDASTPLVSPQAPPDVHFVTPQVVVFHSADGVEVHGQLFVPEGNSKTLRPALVFVHGGPHRQTLPAFNGMDYYSNAYAMNQTLAAQGYVVLSVNYRSGTGYGEAFRNASETGGRGASEYRDVFAAATYLKTRADIDPARIGIWGGSWGGYLTALALARNSDVFAAGADFHGVHDMIDPDTYGLSPEENRKAHEVEWQSSPAADIAHWHAPVLLVHGDDDYNVEFEQSTLLAKLLSEQGVPYEEHSFPNERHTFLRMQDWLTAYMWMDTFFGRTLTSHKP